MNNVRTKMLAAVLAILGPWIQTSAAQDWTIVFTPQWMAQAQFRRVIYDDLTMMAIQFTNNASGQTS